MARKRYAPEQIVSILRRVEALVANGKATDHFEIGRVEHRLIFKAPNGEPEIPIDLIPFGGVAEDDTIVWPPERDTVMMVAGFEDVLAASFVSRWILCSRFPWSLLLASPF